MRKFFATITVFALVLTVFASCNNIDKLTSYEDVRNYILYDHIVYNGIPYYIVDESPDLSEDSYLAHKTVYDVIIVDKYGDPYDAGRKEEAWIFPATDPEIIYIYFNSAYYTKDKSLASEHYGFND